MDTRLCLCLKAPLPGLVKTRLAATLGNDVALAAYLAMARGVLAATRDSGLPTTVHFTPAEAADAVRELCGPDARLVPQVEGDLGRRMDAAFVQGFAAGAEAVVLVGADLPLVTAHSLTQAAKRLETAPAVLGPAEDGGYYLIGFTRAGYVPQAFEAMPWSGPEVARLTLAVCRQAGSPMAVLPTLPDCDTAADLRRLARPAYRTRLAGTPFGVFLAGLAPDSFDQIPTHRLSKQSP